MTEPEETHPGEPEKKDKKKDKASAADKGIETMLKITSTNSQRLSDQADRKAHILITVNSIIISVLLGTVVQTLETDDTLAIPTLLLLSVSLVTIVFSILATRPHVPEGTFTQQEVATHQANLLFFGNFYRMSFEEYAHGMDQLMQDKNFIYQGLLRDVFNQGVVLGKKYRKLTLAYNVFMFGLIVSVAAFFIAARYYAS